MTDQSAQGSPLAAALAKLQAEMPDIPHNQKANADSYEYTYADLKAVTEALYPLMGPLGLSFTAKGVVLPDGRYVLRCSLLHASGEREEGDYPVKVDARHQDIGSAISYGRRYMLGALTGAVTEKDTDGPPEEKPVKRSRKKAEPDQWSTPPPEDQPTAGTRAAPGKLTERQRISIQAGFKELGFEDSDEGRAARLKVESAIVGREVNSTNDLDVSEAAKVLDAIDQKKKEGSQT